MPTAQEQDFDLCPTHNLSISTKYDFGIPDATVIVYFCGCARTIDNKRMGSTMHDSYSKAEENAWFIVDKNRTLWGKE